MYMDDTVIFAHGKDRHEVAAKLTSAMAKISDWLVESFLTLNVSKTACMCFYIRKNGGQPGNFAKGDRIQTVSNFKYSIILIDSQLTFKKHVKHVTL